MVVPGCTQMVAPLSSLALFTPLLAVTRKSASSAVVLHCVNALGLKPARIRSRGFELTERQRKILHLMTQGLTNSAIASKLGFSESLIRQETVKIYRELEVANRQEAGKIYQEMSEAERDKA